MSTIDIRKQEPMNIALITFGDSTTNAAQARLGVWGLSLEDRDGDDVYTVHMEDIDNLILALQKAKELLERAPC